jgi:two-component system sensor histidine kinase KdpD
MRVLLPSPCPGVSATSARLSPARSPILHCGLRGHLVAVCLADDLPLVEIDVTLITRVLTNLLENAIRHAPKGTQITVGAWPSGPDSALVFVADQGPGVSPERREEVFGLLARRDSDAGAGLGLSIAKTFVEAHGQRIWVEDAPEGGARFCLTLPAGRLILKEARFGASAHR